MRIWLFDLDGVLVYPGGYRAALKGTVNHFSRAMGLGDFMLDDSTIETFEACGITSEWDSGPICVAVLAAGLWRADPALRLPAGFDAALAAIRACEPQFPRADFAAWARRIKQAMPANGHPSDTVLSLLLQDAYQVPNRDGRIAEFEGFLRELLEHTRDFSRAPAMRVFQHYTLGSRAFADHYGIPPIFETPSLLRTLDRSALGPGSRDRILELAARGAIRPAIYTSRPCRPRALDARPEDSPPEAEIALDLIRLDLPLIGFGHLCWLAALQKQRPDHFVKPSPVHALAAMGMALEGQERAALEAAEALVKEDRLENPLRALQGQAVEIHVFEDSTNGIRGVDEAARRLQRVGVQADVRAWGIASSPAKRQALQALGVPVCDNVNQAIDEALRL